jgi:hypothetical protein
MQNIVYCKIVVLIMELIVYEAHVEWTCGTYNEATPL